MSFNEKYAKENCYVELVWTELENEKSELDVQRVICVFINR